MNQLVLIIKLINYPKLLVIRELGGVGVEFLHQIVLGVNGECILVQ